MMMLDEIERLTIDLCMKENEELIATIVDSKHNCVGLHVTKIYNQCINEMKSTGDRRLYLFGFIIMALEFRNYWMATRRGDRVIMMSIQNKWIGVHLMSGKHECVENYLNAIELEYSTIDNISYQEIRMNISVRYHDGKDKRGENCHMHHLDEVNRISTNGQR